jgi:hypothetical protein
MLPRLEIEGSLCTLSRLGSFAPPPTRMPWGFIGLNCASTVVKSEAVAKGLVPPPGSSNPLSNHSYVRHTLAFRGSNAKRCRLTDRRSDV